MPQSPNTPALTLALKKFKTFAAGWGSITSLTQLTLSALPSLRCLVVDEHALGSFLP